MEQKRRGGDCGGSSPSAMVASKLCICVLLLSYVDSTAATASCATNDLINVKLFSTSTLKCSNPGFADSNKNAFILWSLKDNVTQYVDIVVAAPVSASNWAAIGFSDQGYMVGSTAMIATLQANASKVTQYKLESQVSPGACVADNSTLSILLGPEVTYDSASSTVYMAFRVDFTNSSAKANWLLWAYGPASADGATIYQHTERTSTQSAFVTGVTGESASEIISKQSKAHGAVNIFGWGVLLPIGAIIARYARGFDPAWFYIHAVCQSLGFIFIIGGVGTGIVLSHKVTPQGFGAHRGIAIFLFALAFLQVLAIVLRPKKDSKVRKYWNWYHKGLGRFALFLAVINIYIGIHIAGGEKSMRVGYSVILAIEIVVMVVLELLLWLRWNRQPYTRSNQTNEGFQFGGTI